MTNALNTAAPHLDVLIFGREYRLACAPEQQSALQAAVALVNGKMQEIGSAAKGKPVSAERAAIMAALNLAHDLLAAQGVARAMDTGATAQTASTIDSDVTARKVADMVQRADAALEAHQKHQDALF